MNETLNDACKRLESAINAQRAIPRPNYSGAEIIKKGKTLYIVKRETRS